MTQCLIWNVCLHSDWMFFGCETSNIFYFTEVTNVLSPSLRSAPVAPSATPEDPGTTAEAASSVSGPARLSMLLAADRQDGVEAGDMTEALTTVAWGLKQLGRASGGMASISRARMSSACEESKETDR